MPRSVTFNGQTLFHPGALSRVSASPRGAVGLSQIGIVHVLGEADGGEPGVNITIDDPADVKATFRSGPLADAIPLLFNPSNDTNIAGGAFRVVAYKTNQSTRGVGLLPGGGANGVIADSTAAGGSTVTVIVWAAGSLTADAHIGRTFLNVTTGESRRIIDNSTTTVTLDRALSTITVGDVTRIRRNEATVTAVDYGAHTGQVSVEWEAAVTSRKGIATVNFETTHEQSPEVAGDAIFRIRYAGGPIPTNGTGTITAIASATTMTVNWIGGVPGDFTGMIAQFSDGTQRLIASNVLADPGDVILNTAHGLSTAQQTDLVNTTITVRNVTQANVSVTGASGVATALSSAILPTAENLALTFTTINVTTVGDLIEYLNANTNYEATLAEGANTARLLTTLDFGRNNTSVDCRFDDAVEDAELTGDDPTFYHVPVATWTPQPLKRSRFFADLDAFVSSFAGFSELATCARATAGATEGAETPDFTGGAATTVGDTVVFLSRDTAGATPIRGISSNTNWQDGYDALLQTRGNHVVALIAEDLANLGQGSTATWLSVAAQLAAHVNAASGIERNERGGYIGFEGTRDAFITEARRLNNQDVQIFSERHSLPDIDGTVVEMPEWSAACLAAGMRAGAELGTPLTFKSPRTSGVTRDTSWTPRNRSDVNALLGAGCMFTETLESGVTRWVRDLTTIQTTEAETSLDGNTRDVVRFVAYDLRTYVENTFTGTRLRNSRDGRPPTIASIRDLVSARLASYVDQDLLVHSQDPDDATKIVPGWDRLRVTLSGSVLRINARIFPVTGVTFELLDLQTEIVQLAA